VDEWVGVKKRTPPGTGCSAPSIKIHQNEGIRAELWLRSRSFAFEGNAHNFRAMRLFNLVLLAFALSSGTVACAGSQGKAESGQSGSMSPAEARDVIDSLRKDQGPPPPDPTSMDEVFSVLKSDDIRRFEGASRFTAGMQGVEGLSVRATIELLSADLYGTGADLVEELARRAAEESARLAEKKESGQQLSDTEKAQEKQGQETNKTLTKAGVALRVLSSEHLSQGGALAQEAIKQYPKSPDGYRGAAYYYLLKFEWIKYDDMMTALEGVGEDGPGMSYYRALESLYRNLDKGQCRAHLKETLLKAPDFVRAQAVLVLVQENIDGRYAELQKLKAMKSGHPIVNIAGPAIVAEYETAVSVRKARAGAIEQEPAPQE
jgi:hypothetical protein